MVHLFVMSRHAGINRLVKVLVYDKMVPVEKNCDKLITPTIRVSTSSSIKTVTVPESCHGSH
jgi:hypothetical protein